MKGMQTYAANWDGPGEPDDADLCREQSMRFKTLKGKTYQPVHGKGWRDAEWQAVCVFTRAGGFGPDAWIEEAARQSKKPSKGSA